MSESEKVVKVAEPEYTLPDNDADPYVAYHTYTEVNDSNQNKKEFNRLNWVGFSRNSLLGIITVLVLAVTGLGGALIYLSAKPDIKRCQNDTTTVQSPKLVDPIEQNLNDKPSLNDTLAVPPNSTAQLRVCKTNLSNNLTLAMPISHAIFSINQVQYEMFHHTTHKEVRGLQHADNSKQTML